MNSLDTHIGRRIFDLRVERDIQQGELARAVGLHQSVLNRIEKGTRPAKAAELYAIAMFFTVSADLLLGITKTSPIFSLAKAAEANPFSSSEKALLNDFRRLDERGQATVRQTIRHELQFVEQNKQKNLA